MRIPKWLLIILGILAAIGVFLMVQIGGCLHAMGAFNG
jgi:hypothetical protein